MKKYRRYSRGFTIMELLVAMAISLVLFAVGFSILNYISASQKQTTARVRSSENARLFFQMLERDLAASQAGPFNMTKTSVPVPASYPTALDPQPIVLRETVSGVSYDILQFYTRADVSDATDHYVFVRYCMDRVNRTLCRQTIKATIDLASAQPDPNAIKVNTAQLPELNDDPRLITNLDPTNAIKFALFDEVDLPYKATPAIDDVDRVYFNLKTWSADDKKFVDTVAPSVATHLEVILEMKYVVDGESVARSRSFTKVFELPW